MSALRRLVAALDSYTATLVPPEARSPHQLSAREAEARLDGWVLAKDDPDWPTFQELCSAAAQLSHDRGIEEFRFSLLRFGMNGRPVKEMPIKLWKRYVTQVNHVLENEGVSFADSATEGVMA